VSGPLLPNGPSSSSYTQVKIRVCEARNLAPCQTNAFADPYAVLVKGRHRFKTHYVTRTLHPLWQARFLMPLQSERAQLRSSRDRKRKRSGSTGGTVDGGGDDPVIISVWDYHMICGDRFLGQVIIRLEEFSYRQKSSHWFPLKAREDHPEDDVRGEIFIGLNFIADVDLRRSAKDQQRSSANQQEALEAQQAGEDISSKNLHRKRKLLSQTALPSLPEQVHPAPPPTPSEYELRTNQSNYERAVEGPSLLTSAPLFADTSSSPPPSSLIMSNESSSFNSATSQPSSMFLTSLEGHGFRLSDQTPSPVRIPSPVRPVSTVPSTSASASASSSSSAASSSSSSTSSAASSLLSSLDALASQSGELTSLTDSGSTSDAYLVHENGTQSDATHWTINDMADGGDQLMDDYVLANDDDDDPMENSMPLTIHQVLTSSSSSVESQGSSSGSGHMRSDSMEFSSHDLGDWNLRFQRTIDAFREVDAYQDVDENSQRIVSYNRTLINLAQDFYYNARTYGKIIISEYYLHNSKKSIFPSNDVGAGGEKYVFHNIIFKFCTAQKTGLFEDDAYAAKVAAHELIGLQSYFHCNIPELCVPMMALVDYRGFRISAVSKVPIDSSTIIYGSDDRGKNVHASNPVFNEKMKLAASIIGLKEHRVGRVLDTSQTLAAPFDVEGHSGRDGRFYLIDFSRVMPPETIQPDVRGCALFRLLRPEFVFKYVKETNIPLCPDAYCPATRIHPGYEIHDREIDVATQHLHKVVIPAFALTLVNSLESWILRGEKPETFRLTETVHSHGVNIRHLGRVVSELRKLSHPMRQIATVLLLCEITARAIKNMIRRKLRETMRNLQVILEEPYRRVVVEYLNVVFGNSKASTTYWDEQLKCEVNAMYPEALSPDELEFAHFKELIVTLNDHSMQYIFKRVVKMTGLIMSKSYREEVLLDPDVFSERTSNQSEPLDEIDLLEIGERVKHMNIVPIAQGYIHLVKGRKDRIDNRAKAQRSYHQAIAKFEEALDSNTTSKVALRNLASSLVALEQVSASGRGTLSLDNPNIKRAEEYFKRAIEIDPQDTDSLCVYARFLQKCSRLRRAEYWYLRTLEVNPNNTTALYQYADLLRYKLNKQKLASCLFQRRSQLQKLLISSSTKSNN